MYHAKLSSKGQTTIPKPVREALQLKPGDRIDFIVQDDGRVVLRARNRRLEDFVGILKRPGQKRLTPEEIDEAIGEAVVERYERARAHRHCDLRSADTDAAEPGTLPRRAGSTVGRK